MLSAVSLFVVMYWIMVGFWCCGWMDECVMWRWRWRYWDEVVEVWLGFVVERGCEVD